MELSQNVRNKIDEARAKYPPEENRAPLIFALHAAQDEYRWLDEPTLEAIADYLGLEPIKVYEAATFYDMFNRSPVGKHNIKVCTNLSCMLCGSDEITDHLRQKLGIDFGQTTEDGRFTLTEVECLGACGGAPVVWIGKEYYEDITPERIDEILASLD
jgi:NADH-quinone oxidoreductase subunit E